MMVKFELTCCEWLNVNRNARLLNKTSTDSKANKGNSSGSIDPQQCHYVLQVTGDALARHLACLTSDRVVRIYEQADLREHMCIARPHGDAQVNEVGFFKSTISGQMLFTCGEDGRCQVWDTRVSSVETPSISVTHGDGGGAREFLCCDISADDRILAIGTNRLVDDALVLLYDLRAPARYLHKLSESHSDDVTQVRFDATRPHHFCSAGLDGLVCLYDLHNENPVQQQHDANSTLSTSTSDQDDDPDLMVQCFNAMTAIQRLGYLDSRSGATTSNLHDADQVFAITLANEVLVWSLGTHDLVYRSPNETRSRLDDANNDNDESFFDCFYVQDRFVTCAANRQGHVKLYGSNPCNDNKSKKTKKDNNYSHYLLCEQQSRSDDNKSSSTIQHRDSIRGSYWNMNTRHLFTAGEDGYVLKWSLSERQPYDEKAIKTDMDRLKNSRKAPRSEQEQEDDQDNNDSRAAAKSAKKRRQ